MKKDIYEISYYTLYQRVEIYMYFVQIYEPNLQFFIEKQIE